jgi:hypothetical protein
MLLPNDRISPLTGRLVLVGLMSLLLSPPPACAQTPAAEPSFARKQTFGVLVAYSNDSSHMLLGQAARRKLFDLGFSYNRRLLAGRIVNWQYSAELLPVALESDPIDVLTYTYSFANPPSTSHSTFDEETLGPCQASSGSGAVPGFYTFTYSGTCGRRWTVGTAMSPVGLQWNFLPRRILQPFADGHGGYMYSTRPIPVSEAGAFNFTFDLGAGVEWFRSPSQSIRAEYRYHHISNKDTAEENPGIDSGLFELSYTWGR